MGAPRNLIFTLLQDAYVVRIYQLWHNWALFDHSYGLR